MPRLPHTKESGAVTSAVKRAAYPKGLGIPRLSRDPSVGRQRSAIDPGSARLRRLGALVLGLIATALIPAISIAVI
jgi:hypothetical protein